MVELLYWGRFINLEEELPYKADCKEIMKKIDNFVDEKCEVEQTIDALDVLIYAKSLLWNYRKGHWIHLGPHKNVIWKIMYSIDACIMSRITKRKYDEVFEWNQDWHLL